ncbi:MAG: XrtA system polysaccharide chain length determinant [Pseudomonadota bacterium]
MNELLTQLIIIISGVWRYRWRALTVAWLVSVAGWLWVYTLPNQFESSTRVYVDTDSPLNPVTRGLATESNVDDEITFMTRTLLSTPQLEQVARETDLDLRAETPKAFDNLIDRLQATIKVSGRDNLYTITYTDRDPEMSFNVVQTLLDRFVNRTLKDGREDTDAARLFIDRQIDDLEERLAASEQELADFKKRNVGLMPGSSGGYYDRLQRAMEELEQVRVEYRLATQNRAELIKQLEGEEPVFGIGAPTSAASQSSSYDVRINERRDQLAELRLNFTDKHPDIIALNEIISSLEAQREEELASRAPLPTPGIDYNPLDANPVYQSLRLSLSQTELDIAQLRLRVAQKQEQVDSLKEAVDTVPEVEAQLARLNRDYAVTKERHEQLLKRREALRLGEDASNSSSQLKFRIIDPPSVPLEPIGPNRMLFITVVLLGGLGAGVGFAFLWNQIKPVFNNRQQLRDITGLPVLGSVSVIMTPRQRTLRRVQTSVFAVGFMMLVLSYFGALVIEEPAVKLAQQLQARGIL